MQAIIYGFTNLINLNIISPGLIWASIILVTQYI